MNSNQLWSRYEAVLKKYNPLGYATLQDPATESEIKEAEQAMKVRFPKELKDAYRRHNGTAEPRWAKNPVLFGTSAASWGNLKSPSLGNHVYRGERDRNAGGSEGTQRRAYGTPGCFPPAMRILEEFHGGTTSTTPSGAD